MVRKIIKNLNSLNSLSNKIILYGSIVSLMLCCLGIVTITYNNTIANQIKIHELGSSMIYTAIVLFSQMVIGGIIIDFLSNVIHNNDE